MSSAAEIGAGTSLALPCALATPFVGRAILMRVSITNVGKTVRRHTQREGLELLIAIVALMWVIEIFNSIDSNRLSNDGIYPRDFGRLWGILTSPFLHASFQHLIDNTIPFVFMGVLIALRGAGRLAIVTLIVIVIGGLGTWLIAPAGTDTIGASGIVFGYATYLFTRGLFNRSAVELLVGIVVGVVWGGALVSSVVPHYGVSWQAHVCGAVGGVVAAAVMSSARPARGKPAGEQPAGLPAALS
jgi:membrane associated rhomboid family serine protease